MKIIVVGAGEIGRHLAMRLSSESHDAVVVDADEGTCRDLEASLDVRVMCADATLASVLIDAGASDADLLFALSSDNNVNLVACAVAGQLGTETTVCRVHPDLQRDELLFNFRERFGVDYLFSPERLAALEISKWIRNPGSFQVEEIGRGSVELQQVEVASDAAVAGATLQELGLPQRIRVGTILREGRHFVPRPHDTIEAGDRVVLFGDPLKLSDVIGRFGSRHRRRGGRKVTIFGGGEYGFALAQLLEGWDFHVRIFDSDRERCEWLGTQLENAVVINADATNLTEMKEEQVGDSDYFVASTGTDEDNVMTCLQAHDLGVDSCYTLIHRQDYAEVILRAGKHFGIKAAISPREVVSHELMRFITSDRFHVVRTLDGVELIEVTVGERAPVAGRRVREVDWPHNTGLVALLRGTNAFVPGAEDEIREGDNLFAMVAPVVRREFLKLVRPK